MTIGGRIRIARRSFGLNQTEFGARVGLSQAAIAGYENDSHSVAEQTLIHICKEYKINESWIRDGLGEMLDDRSEDFISDLSQKYSLDPLQQSLVRAVYEMPQEYRTMILELARRLVAESEEESKEEIAKRDFRTARAARDAEEDQNADERA